MSEEAWSNNRIATGLLAVIVTILLGTLLVEMQSVMLPLVIAVYLSYLFKPIILFLKKRHVPVFVGLIIVVVLVAGLLFGFSMILYNSVDSFIQAAPRYQAKLETLLDSLLSSAFWIANQLHYDLNDIPWQDTIQISSVTSFVTSGMGSFVSFFSNAVLILLFMMFILAGTGDMTAKVAIAFKDHHSRKIGSIIASIDEKVRQYLITKTIISLVTGGVSAIILAIVGVDFALLWGFIIFLLNFIPNVGSLIATVLPVLMSLLQFDGIGVSLLVLVLLVAVQFTMGNIVEPRVMAFSLNLSPVLVLVSLGVWGWIWGVWGMILSIPIMSTLKIVMEHIEPLAPLAHLMGGHVKPVADAQRHE